MLWFDFDSLNLIIASYPEIRNLGFTRQSFFSLECKITSFTYASLFRYQVFLSLLLIFCIKKDLISYPHTPQFYFIFHLNLMNFLAPYFHSLGCLVFCIEILSTARDIIRIRFIPELQDRIEDWELQMEGLGFR